MSRLADSLPAQFDRRRHQLLQFQVHLRAISQAQPLASIRCTLCVRIGEKYPEPGSSESERINRLAFLDARYLDCYPIPPSDAGGGRFLLYCDPETTTPQVKTTLLSLENLAETASSHLRSVGFDLGDVPGGLGGWLWLVYVVAWKFPSSEHPLGYSLLTGILSDTMPDDLAKSMARVHFPGGPSIFNAVDFRWGEWASHRTETQSCCELYELNADLLVASQAAIEAIIYWTDRRHADTVSHPSLADGPPDSAAQVDEHPPLPDGRPAATQTPISTPVMVRATAEGLPRTADAGRSAEAEAANPSEVKAPSPVRPDGPCQAWIIAKVAEAGRRINRADLIQLAKEPIPLHGESTVRNEAAKLTKCKLLIYRHKDPNDGRGIGYGLPEWE